MALELYMVGLTPRNLAQSLEFYRRLGLAIPDGSDGQPHIGVKMKGDLTFFLNTTSLTRESDRPRTVLEFYLKERPIVDAKYAEMIAFGYQSYHAPYVSPFGIYFAMINDPDGNIILLSAD